MDSAAIVDLRANVKPVLSTLTGMKATAGFSYILNELRFSCGRPHRPPQKANLPYRPRGRQPPPGGVAVKARQLQTRG
jgi:hypothetical protein